MAFNTDHAMKPTPGSRSATMPQSQSIFRGFYRDNQQSVSQRSTMHRAETLSLAVLQVNRACLPIQHHEECFVATQSHEYKKQLIMLILLLDGLPDTSPPNLL